MSYWNCIFLPFKSTRYSYLFTHHSFHQSTDYFINRTTHFLTDFTLKFFFYFITEENKNTIYDFYTSSAVIHFYMAQGLYGIVSIILIIAILINSFMCEQLSVIVIVAIISKVIIEVSIFLWHYALHVNCKIIIIYTSQVSFCNNSRRHLKSCLCACVLFLMIMIIMPCVPDLSASHIIYSFLVIITMIIQGPISGLDLQVIGRTIITIARMAFIRGSRHTLDPPGYILPWTHKEDVSLQEQLTQTCLTWHQILLVCQTVLSGMDIVSVLVWLADPCLPIVKLDNKNKKWILKI